MKKQNRILAFVLTMAMLITMVPASVFTAIAVEPETDETVTYDFSNASDLFVPKVSTETTQWTIGPAPDNATAPNQVMVSAGGGQNVVYGPATWPGKEGWYLKKLSFRFNIHGLNTNLSFGGQRIVIWQNPQDPTDYIAIDWRREGTQNSETTKMFNASVTVCKDGATSSQWCVTSLQITEYKGDYGEDSWCTFTAEYEDDMNVLLTVTSDMGDEKFCRLTGISGYWQNGNTKTGVENALGITDFDYRTGYIGFTPPTGGQTMYYDDVVLTFDGPSVAATQFKTDYADILAMAPDTFEATYATAKEDLVTALGAYEALSANAKALLTTEKSKLDALEAVMDSIEEAELFKPLQKTDLTDGAFTWSFENASHAFKENVGTAVDGFGITTDPTDSNNKVLKVPGGQTVYTPRRWNSNYNMVSATWEFNLKDIPIGTGDPFNEIILWQSNTEPENYISWFWKRETGNFFNDGNFKYKAGASRVQDWWNPQLRIGDFTNTENMWFTLTATYGENQISLTLTSKDGTVNKTGSITVTDMGDLRQGRIGVKGSHADANTIYYDNISVRFDLSAEEAADFQTTYAALLAMTPTQFRAEYTAQKDNLVAALEAYEKLSDSAKALLTEEEGKLAALEAEMDAIIEEAQFASLTKNDLINGVFTWTFEDPSHAFKENLGEAKDGFGITVDPTDSNNQVLTVPGANIQAGGAVYTPRRWNSSYSMVSATWVFNTKNVPNEGGDWFNEIVLWQDKDNPGTYLSWFWKQEATQYFNDGYFVYKDGVSARAQVWNAGLRPGAYDTTDKNLWFTLTAVYSEKSIALTLTGDGVSKTSTINYKDFTDGRESYNLPANVDFRQGKIGVKSAAQKASTIYYDNISVKFELSPAETAADFEETYAALLEMDEEAFRAAYDTVKQTQTAAQADFAVMSDEAKACLTSGVEAKMDALNTWAVIIENERLHASLTKDDLTDYTYTWKFEKADYANPFYAAQGTAADGFGYAAFENTDGVLKVPMSTTAIYKPMHWGSDFMMESVSWEFNVKDQTKQAVYFNEIRVWQDPVKPENYVAFCWRYENSNVLNTQYQIHVGSTVHSTWTDSMHVTEDVAKEERWFTLTADYTKTGIKLTVSSACLETPKSLQVNETQLAELNADLRKGDIAIRCQNTNLYFDTITAKFTQKSVDGDLGHTITMHNGAYLKTNGTIGIRFGADITGETERKAIGWGVLVLPANKLGEKELNLDWTDLDTTPVYGVTAAHGYQPLESSADLPNQIYGSIIEIINGDYPTMSVVARMYVKYEGDIVVYSDLSVSRSMYQTAMKGVNSYIASGKITGETPFTPEECDTTDVAALTENGKKALQILADAGIIQWSET